MKSMSERTEFHPLPAEPDKYETPVAKNKRLAKQQKGWQEIDLDDLDDKEEEKKAA